MRSTMGSIVRVPRVGPALTPHLCGKSDCGWAGRLHPRQVRQGEEKSQASHLPWAPCPQNLHQVWVPDLQARLNLNNRASFRNYGKKSVDHYRYIQKCILTF